MTFIQMAHASGAAKSFTFTGTATANGSLNTVTITGSGEADFLVNNGTTLTATAGGYWSLFAQVGGYNNTGVRIITEGVTRATESSTPNAPDYLGGVATHWIGLITDGGSIAFQGRANTVCNLNMTCVFVPTPANPK